MTIIIIIKIVLFYTGLFTVVLNMPLVHTSLYLLAVDAQPALDNGLHVANTRVDDGDVVMGANGDDANNSSAAENNEEGADDGISLL